MSSVDLTIVVCPTSATAEALSGCLDAIAAGFQGLSAECIVPCDDRVVDRLELTARYSWCRWLDVEASVADLPRCSHERHHRLRAQALRVARGRIIAMVEDHGPPDSTWPAAILDAHRRHQAAAIGGAVVNDIPRRLNEAVWLCDFSRYVPPLHDPGAAWITDVNISYRREPLLELRDLWWNAYYEPLVNDALRTAGHRLVLDDALITHQCRRDLRLVSCLPERIVWARSYAAQRVRQLSRRGRWLYAGGSGLLPWIRTGRVVRRAVHRRLTVRRLPGALPLVFLLECCWAWGEFVGYVTGRAGLHIQVTPSIERNPRTVAS